jgi:hypothetical protein
MRVTPVAMESSHTTSTVVCDVDAHPNPKIAIAAADMSAKRAVSFFFILNLPLSENLQLYI